MAKTWNSGNKHKLTKRQQIVEEKYPSINTLCYNCYNAVLGLEDDEEKYPGINVKEISVAKVLNKTIVNDDYNEATKTTNWWCDFCGKWMLRYVPINQGALNALE